MPVRYPFPLRPGMAALGMLIALNASAAIYKWVDEEGKITYSDQPQGNNAVAVDIRVSQPAARADDTGKDNQSQASGKPKTPEETPARPTQAEPQKNEPPKLSRKEKRARCADARKRLQAITARNRVRERDASGNTRYLSEKERQARLKQARKNIRKYCR